MITIMLHPPQKKKLRKKRLLKLLTLWNLCIAHFYSDHQWLSCPPKTTENQKPMKEIGTTLLYLHCIFVNLPIQSAPD